MFLEESGSSLKGILAFGTYILRVAKVRKIDLLCHSPSSVSLLHTITLGGRLSLHGTYVETT